MDPEDSLNCLTYQGRAYPYMPFVLAWQTSEKVGMRSHILFLSLLKRGFLEDEVTEAADAVDDWKRFMPKVDCLCRLGGG